ncbi:MAG: hypothetical protein MUE56_07255 [Ignavibacteria bacterium]|jgi:hypothetical protein|nr:hypothetical protein [Ignavibacteria bacterium]
MDKSKLYKKICGMFTARTVFLSAVIALTAAFSSIAFSETTGEVQKAGILAFFVPLMSFESFLLVSIIKAKIRNTKMLGEIINISRFDDVRIKKASPDSVIMPVMNSGISDFILQIRRGNILLLDMIFRRNEKEDILITLDPIMKKAGLKIINSHGLDDDGSTSKYSQDLSYFVFET